MHKAIQKGLTAARTGGALPGTPEKWQRVFRPAEAVVRKHQWDALTKREKMRATLEYYWQGKRFVGLDFSGNKYFEMPDGERIVEWPNSRDILCVKETIPVVWKLWLHDRSIAHPPHPEELVRMEEEEAAQQRRVQERLKEEAKAVQRTQQQGAKPMPTDQELDEFDLKEQADKVVGSPRPGVVGPMPGGSGKPYVASKQDWDNP
eukprot:GGOE01049267.1.p2 GENE.GGOE01049267.1~~GGOE01049267.1.p2  ORF type:complete len:205 (-),score=75.95 GGOE01049267.1:125-739(-)